MLENDFFTPLMESTEDLSKAIDPVPKNAPLQIVGDMAGISCHVEDGVWMCD